MTDELDTPQAEGLAAGEDPTPEEEQDLLALLQAPPEPKRFYLPTKGGESEEFFLELKPWTGMEKARYENAGHQYTLPERNRARAQDTSRLPEMRVSQDEQVQRKVLLETSVCGFRLPLGAKTHEYKGAQSVMSYFNMVPPAVLEWAVRCARQFQGIEVVRVGGGA